MFSLVFVLPRPVYGTLVQKDGKLGYQDLREVSFFTGRGGLLKIGGGSGVFS